MRIRKGLALILACGILAACDGGKKAAFSSLEEARIGVETARNWGAETFAPKLHGDAERELAAAEKAYAEGRYTQVVFPAQRAVIAAHLARAEAAKLPKHSPEPLKSTKNGKAKK